MHRCRCFAVAALAAPLISGCTGDLIANLTEERTWNITVVFINNTPFRANFSFGTFDSLDRNPPSAPAFQQQRVEAFTTSATQTIGCRRNFAIGTQEFLERTLITGATNVATFDPDLFIEGIAFSSAAPGSDAADLPTDGIGPSFEALLGVDFTCLDQLIITFSQDDTAPTGFSVKLEVLPDLAGTQ